MKFYLFLVLIALNFNLFSQGFGKGIENQTNLNQLTSNDPTQVIRQYDDRYAGVKGSPYLMENFISGQVTMNDGKVYKSAFLNYDAYEDELLFKKDINGLVMVVNKQKINAFEMDSTRSGEYYRFQNFGFGSPNPSGFYAVLYDGKIKLLCRISKTFIKADFKGAYSAGQEYDKFVDQKQYFFLPKDNGPIPFKANTQSILNTSPIHSELIRNFIKRKKINSKRLSDLVTIFQYIDTL